MKKLMIVLLALSSSSALASKMPSITIEGKAASRLAEASEFDHVWLGNFVSCGLNEKNNPYCEILTMNDVYVNTNEGSLIVYGFAAKDLNELDLNAGANEEVYSFTGLSCGNAVLVDGNLSFCKIDGYIADSEGANIKYEN